MANAEAVTQADATTGPQVLGRYRLTRRLGSGGMGIVWLAHDEQLDRMVAVKRIDVGDEAVAKRAEREAKAAARLGHPAIVALFEAARDEEAVYLVSELVRGRTLAQLMADGELSDRDACAIGAALCEALAHAHQRGVVHRDVKPANVIVPDDGVGVAKLTDFGIARLHGEDVLTRTGDIVGTLAYMAPEQADGKDAGPEADLYALGLVVYEALAGVNPVRGRTPGSTARRVGVRLPPLERLRRDLPLELCRAIDRAVVPRPAERGKLKDLRAALRAAVADVDDEPGTVEAGALEPVTRVARVVGGHRRVRLDDDLTGEPWVQERTRATPSARLIAALGTGALAAAALHWLGPQPPLQPLAGGAIAAGTAALLPRLGWLGVMAALTTWMLALAQAQGGLALLLLVAAAPTAILLWRTSGAWWSVPSFAALLGAVGVGGAFPALAGQARSVVTRAALGALGLWWLLLAELLTDKRLLLGPAPDTGAGWETSARAASEHALWPAIASGALAIAALWALAAAVLPLIVRGRAAALDLVVAGAWAAGLASATQAIAESLGWAPQPRGLAAGAVVACVIAVGARAWRGPA